MTAALSRAISNEEWIVVTGWDPHWKFASWDLKFLQQDEDKMIWETGNIHMMGRADLEEDKPELAQFLRNMFFTEEQLADLMLAVEESDRDVADVTRDWMYENEDLVDSWIPDEDELSADY